MFPSCKTVRTPYLVAVDDCNTEIYLDRGYTVHLADDSGVAMTVEGLDVGVKDKGVVLVGFENSTESLYGFRDSNLEIFGGNYETGKWESLGTWDAEAFYDKVQSKADTAFAFQLLSIFVDVATKNSHGHGSSGSLIATGTRLAAAGATIDSVTESNLKSPKWLKENMLYSSTVRPHKDYYGVVLFDGRNQDKKPYPDFKLVYQKTDGSEQEFIFQRSDRESAMNPWIDKPRYRLSIAANVDLTRKGGGLMLINSHPAGLQVYSGVSVDSTGLTFPVGVTLKALSNTWLMAGFNFLLGSYGSSNIVPQIGVNIITNRLSVYALADYSLLDRKLGLNVGIGYAFIV